METTMTTMMERKATMVVSAGVRRRSGKGTTVVSVGVRRKSEKGRKVFFTEDKYDNNGQKSTARLKPPQQK
jgi:hypothetical protein